MYADERGYHDQNKLTQKKDKEHVLAGDSVASSAAAASSLTPASQAKLLLSALKVMVFSGIVELYITEIL
jgi:hypothetical protein